MMPHSCNQTVVTFDSFGSRVVLTALANRLPEGSWVNVNVPNLPVDKVKGVKLTKQGVSTYQEYFAEIQPKDGVRCSFFILSSPSCGASYSPPLIPAARRRSV
jgi:broad specificity polyphosphatase/5'/3'-nucleotidase SurE